VCQGIRLAFNGCAMASTRGPEDGGAPKDERPAPVTSFACTTPNASCQLQGLTIPSLHPRVPPERAHCGRGSQAAPSVPSAGMIIPNRAHPSTSSRIASSLTDASNAPGSVASNPNSSKKRSKPIGS